MLKTAFWVVFATVQVCHAVTEETRRDVKQQPELTRIVRNWAEKLGGELWHFGEMVTRRNTVIESYKHFPVVAMDPNALVKEIAAKLKEMMDEKIQAVRRIMEVAENKVESMSDYVEPNFDFINAKDLTNSAVNETLEETREINDENYPQAEELRKPLEEKFRNAMKEEENYSQDQGVKDPETPLIEEISHSNVEVTDGEQDPLASQAPVDDKRRLPLYPNPHFYDIPVNTNHSAVHVPSNVFDRSKEVIQGIKWSEELDMTFKNNYKNDPTLSWQYFGSSTGFMRQFPAMIWSQEPIDLYDCRTRSWYIEAASSPKDIIILVDRSGSMTGMRREVARHVVNNILDTLGHNDYVNVFSFSNTTEPLIECFDDMMVQANLANVRALKEALSEFKTEQIANFSLAFETAFELLQSYRERKLGALCNQAIMLVTDGVQNNYIKVFQDYNWKNLPFMPVRVFTYLIGREVSDVREVKWMACANQGFYVHLSTYAEVREQVLQYIPVMARPMVLNPLVKPNPTWSPIYADVTDPKLTNWLWINRERNRQRDIFLQSKRNRTFFPSEDHDKRYVHKIKHKDEDGEELQIYRLMTSVSLPVYDKRPNATRVANLLGVAGTDVPIEYIKRHLVPYKSGVNGYAFIVTNNGYVLTHPDLRPVFQGILKPAYNRVDMMEVEIIDDDAEPRDFNESIIELRRNVIAVHEKKKHEAMHVMLRVKTHLDDLRRVMILNRHYYYAPVEKTPFTVVIALPDKYTFNRVYHNVADEIHRMRFNNQLKGPFRTFFTGNWTIHPEWFYCKYLDDVGRFQTLEEELLHFLDKSEKPGWKWTKECDRDLVQALVNDARITEWFSQNITTATAKDDNGPEFIKRFGITVAFMATHSGLTRWQDFPQNVGDRSTKDEPHFHHIYNKAIDEIWYRRAVEQHFIEPRSFVYSVPFDAGTGDGTDIVVTATHAIFKEEGSHKAPVAVVGYQFYHSALQSFFTSTTNSCGEIPCKRTCSSGELHCLILDDNGYVIVSDQPEDTGRFFGHIRPDIMNQLTDEGVYKAVRMYDYQATCFHLVPAGNPATSPSFSVIRHVWDVTRWITATALYFLQRVVGQEIETSYTESEEEDDDSFSNQPLSRANEKEFDERLRIKKTRPEPCDQEMWLYTLANYVEPNVTITAYDKVMTNDCTRPFIVQPVVGSNFIFLVINSICPGSVEQVAIKSIEPVEVDYNGSITCFRALHNNYYHRQYMSCINRNVQEKDIVLCGRGASTSVGSLFVIGVVLALL